MNTPSISLTTWRTFTVCTSFVLLFFGSYIYDEIVIQLARGKPNLTVIEDTGGIRFAVVGAISFMALSMLLERIGIVGLRLESLRRYSIVGFVAVLATLLWELNSAALIASLSDSNGKIQIKAEHLFSPLVLWRNMAFIVVALAIFHTAIQKFNRRREISSPQT
jgi:hypothetical protein